MKGSVEVFKVYKDGSEELIASEDNLIVNGAGEAIVDMLTTPSCVLGISPRNMDVSNFRLGALSFGPAASAFQENAFYVTSEAIADPNSWVNIDRSVAENRIVRTLWVSGSIGEGHGATASSYTPPYRLPSYPDPLDRYLEKDASTAYAIVSGDGTQSFGQYENRIRWNNSDASAYLVGAYADEADVAAGDPFIALVSSLEGDFEDDYWLNMIVSSTHGGSTQGYNGRGQVDYRGFIQVLSLVDAQEKFTMTDPRGFAYVSGMIDSSYAQDFSLDPRIMLTTEIHFDDLKMFQVYGGLHQLGLWTLNCKKSLENGTAPFSWLDADGVTPREFTLFAKKTFTENLVRRSDEGTAGLLNAFDLRITWIIDFRLQHD